MERANIEGVSVGVCPYEIVIALSAGIADTHFIATHLESNDMNIIGRIRLMALPHRISLSPDEVEELEAAGYVVRVLSIASFTNGKRWCVVERRGAWPRPY